jgi:acyl-CoA thioester hydrolase
MGVVYHSHYLIWCELGRTDHIRESGMSYREMEEAGIMLAVAEANIRYRAPARYDDLIRVETTLTDVSSRAVTFEYRILNAETNELLATASTLLVALDSAHRVAKLPAEIRERLETSAGATA